MTISLLEVETRRNSFGIFFLEAIEVQESKVLKFQFILRYVVITIVPLNGCYFRRSSISCNSHWSSDFRERSYHITESING